MKSTAFRLAAAFCVSLIGGAGGAGAACIGPDTLALKHEAALTASPDGYAMTEVELPAVAYLGVVAYAKAEGEDAILHSWPATPAHGIDRWRMCGNVSIGPATVAAGRRDWRQLAISLQTQVDYAALYPAAHRRLTASGQLMTGDAGRYMLVRFEGKAPVKGAPGYERAREAAGGCDGFVVWGRRAILFPTC